MSEEQLNFIVDEKISSILKAAKDYQNNPDEVKDFIIRTVRDISKASKNFGESVLVNELFG